MQYTRLIIFILIIVLLGVLSVYYPYLTGEVVSESSFYEKEYEKESVFVIRIIDGDTIETDNATIRLLGINTPERGKEYYQEAKDFLKQIENKSIEVLRDFEDIDKYDRKLRYVFYDNRLINVEILEQGLGTSFMLEDLRYEDKLEMGEEFAKKSGNRLWEKSEEICADCIKLVELNSENEYFILENDCNFDCNLEEWHVKDDANHFVKMGMIPEKGTVKFESKGNIWNNNGDRFFMRDDDGRLVIFWEY